MYSKVIQDYNLEDDEDGLWEKFHKEHYQLINLNLNKIFKNIQQETYSSILKKYYLTLDLINSEIDNGILNKKAYKNLYKSMSLLSTGGFAIVFSYDGMILRFLINSVKKTSPVTLTSEKMALFLKYGILKYSPISKLITVPKYIIYKNKLIAKKFYDYVLKFSYLINILYKDANQLTQTTDEDLDIVLLTERLKQIYSDPTLILLLKIMEHKIFQSDILLSVPNYKNIIRTFEFFSVKKIPTVDYSVFSMAIADCFKHKINDLPFLYIEKNIKLLYLQMGLVLLGINLKCSFLHDDLKIDNVLIFNEKEPIHIDMSLMVSKLKYSFYINEGFIYQLNDFDLSTIAGFPNKNFKHTWLTDLCYLTQSIFVMYFPKYPKNEFVNYLQTMFIDNKTFEDNKLVKCQDKEDDINNLIDFLDSKYFSHWRINNV